jgi:hypothetical protein
VPKNGSVHLQFLEELFTGEVIIDTEECGAVESVKSKSLFCGKYLKDIFQPLTNYLLST